MFASCIPAVDYNRKITKLFSNSIKFDQLDSFFTQIGVGYPNLQVNDSMNAFLNNEIGRYHSVKILNIIEKCHVFKNNSVANIFNDSIPEQDALNELLIEEIKLVFTQFIVEFNTFAEINVFSKINNFDINNWAHALLNLVEHRHKKLRGINYCQDNYSRSADILSNFFAGFVPHDLFNSLKSQSDMVSELHDMRIKVSLYINSLKRQHNTNYSTIESRSSDDHKYPMIIYNQMNLITSHPSLSDKSKEYYSGFLTQSNWHNVKHYSKVIVGDTDGSSVVMILVGILSGIIRLNYDGIEALIKLMNIESDTWDQINNNETDRDDCITNFQKDSDEIKTRIFDLILSNAKYYPIFREVTFAGDFLHERLIFDQKMTVKLLLTMYENGVKFVMGNHEQIVECSRSTLNSRNFLSPIGLVESGAYARKKIADDWQLLLLQKQIFKKAILDNSGNMIIHHGFKVCNLRASIITAFGSIDFSKVDNKNQFIDAINQLDEYQTLIDGSISDTLVGNSSTAFTVNDDSQMLANNVLLQKKGIHLNSVYHGHSGSFVSTDFGGNINSSCSSVSNPYLQTNNRGKTTIYRPNMVVLN